MYLLLIFATDNLPMLARHEDRAFSRNLNSCRKSKYFRRPFSILENVFLNAFYVNCVKTLKYHYWQAFDEV